MLAHKMWLLKAFTSVCNTKGSIFAQMVCAHVCTSYILREPTSLITCFTYNLQFHQGLLLSKISPTVLTHMQNFLSILTYLLDGCGVYYVCGYLPYAMLFLEHSYLPMLKTYRLEPNSSLTTMGRELPLVLYSLLILNLGTCCIFIFSLRVETILVGAGNIN